MATSEWGLGYKRPLITPSTPVEHSGPLRTSDTTEGSGGKLIVVDTETGGLDPARHSILSVAAVVWDSAELGDACEFFVAESVVEVAPTAILRNNIDVSWVCRNGISPAAAVEKLNSFLEFHFPGLKDGQRVALAGHNVAFDVGFLKRLYRLAGADYEKVFSHRVLDTASVARFLMLAGRLAVSGVGLDELLTHFGLTADLDERHSALGDAKVTAQLLQELVKLVNLDASRTEHI